MNVPIGNIVFLIPAIIAFIIYVSTASSSIAGGDAGELVAEGCQLGTAHPPGYPLYVLIIGAVVRIASHIDDAWSPDERTMTPAYWVNVTSCLFGAISTGLISSIVFRLTKASEKDNFALRVSCAVSTSLLCAFSPLMWKYNKEAEVFALHNLFVSSILYVLVLYEETIVDRNRSNAKSIRDSNDVMMIIIGAFLCGLSMTNQHTSILLILPVVSYVLYQSTIFRRPGLLMASAAAFLLGMSPYIALPIMAHLYPHAGSWGDVTSFDGFLHHFLRRDYGTYRLFSGDDSGSEGMVVRTISWANDFAFSQLCHPLLCGFLIIGVLSQVVDLWDGKNDKTKQAKITKKSRKSMQLKQHTAPVKNRSGMVILFSLAFYLIVFHSLSNLPLSNPLLFGIHQRFWMHSNILAFILLGAGIHSLDATMTKYDAHWPSLALSASTLLLPLIQYRQNIDYSDQSLNTYFHSYAMSILESLPERSLLLINYDQQWTRYLQECEGFRNDVQSINLSMMTYPWWKTKHHLYQNVDFPGTHYTKINTMPWASGGFTFSEFIDANMVAFQNNIFVGGKINYQDNTFDAEYEEIPHGLVRRIETREEAASYPVEVFRQDSLGAWVIVASHLSSNLPCKKKYSSYTWEWTIAREFFEHMISRATYLLDMALKNNANSQLVLPSIAEAAAWLELSSSWDVEGKHTSSPSMKKNLGLAYMNIVRSRENKFPIPIDIFNANAQYKEKWWSGESNNEKWKAWATTLWKEEWSTFLSLESAQMEPDYDQIRSIYEAVMSSSRQKNR